MSSNTNSTPQSNSNPTVKRPTLRSASASYLDSSDVSSSIPDELQKGIRMTKVTEKKVKDAQFRIDPDEGRIVYESKKSGIIPVETIKELRFNSDASYYRVLFKFPPEVEPRWTTIVFILDGSYKTIHVISPSVEVFNLWKPALEKLFKIRQGLMTGLQNNRLRDALWEKQYWKGADRNNDQKLDFKELQDLCLRLNLNFLDSELSKVFKEADVHNRGYLDFTDFRRLVKIVKRQPEIETIYNNLCAPGDKLTFEKFEKFMRESQESHLTPEELKNVFAKHSQKAPIQTGTENPSPETAAKAEESYMNLDNFSTFLRSPDNSAFPERSNSVHHDMTRPLSEYFISSSHNTYLIGHQLVGISTIEGYIRALLHSCRTVELDIYDGDEEPMVYHGKTFTSKVPVREICQAIAKYAFVASPYPVVISAEVHCGVQQQDMVVKTMQTVFGDALISAPVDGRPKIDCLPSPEDLRGKILLKAKNLFVAAQLESLRALQVAEAAAKRRAEIEAEVSATSSSSSSEDDTDIFAELRSLKHRIREKTSRRKAAKKPKVRMSMNLLSLLVYTVGVKCRGFGSEHYAPEHMFSLSENSANKYLKGSMKDVIKHTQTHMIRVYPKGTRVSSTNYEPHRFWAAGAQVVALNLQTFDIGYMINQVMFQRNGRSGYVRKPAALLPDGEELLNKYTEHYLDIMVISAQQLPRPRDALGHEIIDKSIVDPYVEVSLHIPVWSKSPFLPGGDVESGKTPVSYSPPNTRASETEATSGRTVSFKTKSVKNNGFNPVWNEELCIPFDCMGDMKELVFVRFAIRQQGDNDEPLATYCAPLGCLQHGFRYLPLHDSQLAQYLFSTLFVQINVRDVKKSEI
ncbi:PLC-like phosphodiesterase [Marasmius fiardii PR-910]|nr:PLC-like phosphodiesterase [Marasmius fiardii PR-910]